MNVLPNIQIHKADSLQWYVYPWLLPAVDLERNHI